MKAKKLSRAQKEVYKYMMSYFDDVDLPVAYELAEVAFHQLAIKMKGQYLKDALDEIRNG